MLNNTQLIRNGFVRVPPKPLNEGLPDDLEDLVEQAIDLGDQFGRGLIKRPLEESVSAHQRSPANCLKIQQEITESLGELFDGHKPKTAAVIKLAVLTGAGDRLLTKRGRSSHNPSWGDLLTISAMRHWLFPQVLMSLSWSERTRLFNAVYDCHRPKKWAQAFSGGIVVSRLAHIINRHGFPVWLTPLYYDINCGGDMVAEVDGEPWYIQVKAVPSHLPTCFRRLLGNQPEMVELLRLWHGARIFSSSIGRVATPIIAFIGMDGYRIETIEGCHTTSANFAGFLAEQRRLRPTALNNNKSVVSSAR